MVTEVVFISRLAGLGFCYITLYGAGSESKIGNLCVIMCEWSIIIIITIIIIIIINIVNNHDDTTSPQQSAVFDTFICSLYS